MRRGNGLVFVFLGLFIFSASVALAAEKETINLGSVASLTGYLSDQAQNCMEGIELAIESVNAKGGVLGRQLKVHSRDDEMKPPVGARRFEDGCERHPAGQQAAGRKGSGPVPVGHLSPGAESEKHA
jgi:hypothetical protein